MPNHGRNLAGGLPKKSTPASVLGLAKVPIPATDPSFPPVPNTVRVTRPKGPAFTPRKLRGESIPSPAGSAYTVIKCADGVTYDGCLTVPGCPLTFTAKHNSRFEIMAILKGHYVGWVLKGREKSQCQRVPT
jgi:hypothetical protein